METEELLSKLDMIEEQAKCTLEEFPQLTKERQRMIIALAKQIRWMVSENTPGAMLDPEATVPATVVKRVA